jgi:hypothetical protein
MKYELNSPNIYTYLGHFTNFVYNLMIDVQFNLRRLSVARGLYFLRRMKYWIPDS